MKYIVFVIFLYISLNIYAEQSLLSGNYNYLETSDDMYMQYSNVVFRSHRRDLSYPYEEEELSAWDYGLSLLLTEGYNSKYFYSGQKAEFLIGRKFSSNFLIDCYAGGHRLFDTNNDNAQSIIIGGIKFYFHIDELLDMSLLLNRDFAYIHNIQPGSIDYRLMARAIYFAVNYKLPLDIMARGSQNTLILSDENIKSVTNISLLYGIFTSEPWLWIGIGYENTAYQFTTPDYWSPSTFMAFGFRSEASIPIYLIDNVFFNFELNYNRLWDKDAGEQGDGFVFASKLQLGRRDENNLAIYYNRITSVQDSSTWYSNEAGLTINLML